MFHTAHYNEGLDLKGKRVAVIGSGSSGVQVCASIYAEVDKLYTWVRSPTWITAAFGQKFAGKDGSNFECWSHLSSGLRYNKLTDFVLQTLKNSNEILRRTLKCTTDTRR